MGYEKGITRKWSDMILDGEYPDRIPGGPRSPDSPSGGTPNHELLARAARLTWAMEKRTQQQRDEELKGVVQFFDNQVEGGFMTRGGATEQLSPSHSQWWITAVLGLRWLGWKVRQSSPDVSRKLMEVTGRWLRHHHALCRLFATREGIVAPGARAWPIGDPARYYGRCKVRDELYKAVESGRVKRLWTADNLDMLGLIFADKLLEAGDDLGGARQARELPKLRWPVAIRRAGENFTAWLTTIEGNAGLHAQRRATWRGGADSYDFDDSLEDEWPETERRILGERPGRDDGGGRDTGGSQGGDGGGDGGGDQAGLAALAAELRGIAERRQAVRDQATAFADRLAGPAPDVAAIVTGLRELADRRPNARGELLSVAERLERL